PAGRRASVASVPEPAPQMSLFEADPAAQEILNAVRALDPNRMTPLEALLKLVELRERAG
ncbi:MAG: hypothetical protein AAGI08_10935, partial [Bacteroidota bacterium]